MISGTQDCRTIELTNIVDVIVCSTFIIHACGSCPNRSLNINRERYRASHEKLIALAMRQFFVTLLKSS